MGDAARPPAKELASWKEIAEYLGVNVRTAQKWERERGLPVRRLPGGKGRVSAELDDLNTWKAQTAENPRWWNRLRFVQRYALAMTLLALLATGLWLREVVAGRHHGPPAAFRADYATLTVLDGRGRPLWEHTFSEPLLPTAYTGYEGQQHVWFGDLDGDGRVETLFAFSPSRSTTSDAIGDTLFCFAQDGALKWQFDPGKAVTDAGGMTYSPHYIISGFAVVDLGLGRRMIAATTRQLMQYPTRFVLLDARGKLAGEYWNSGHLDFMQFVDLDGDGIKEILLAGVNNGYQAAELVVLDPRNFSGTSNQGASRYQILGFPLGKEKAVVVFPRTCIARRFGMYNMARMVTPVAHGIRVEVFEHEEENVLYTLDRTLAAAQVEVSDSFRNAHRIYHASGELDHALSDAEIQGLRSQVKVYRGGQAPESVR